MLDYYQLMKEIIILQERLMLQSNLIKQYYPNNRKIIEVGRNKLSQ